MLLEKIATGPCERRILSIYTAYATVTKQGQFVPAALEQPALRREAHPNELGRVDGVLLQTLIVTRRAQPPRTNRRTDGLRRLVTHTGKKADEQLAMPVLGSTRTKR